MKSASIAAATFAFTLLAIACTTTTTTTEPTVSDKDAGTTKDAGKDKDAGKATDDDDDDTTPAACGDETTFQACVQCCAEETPAGYQKYIEVFDTCMCKADVCGDKCGDNYCKDPQTATKECEACLDADASAKACDADFQKNCGGSQDCVKFVTCGQSCPDPQ